MRFILILTTLLLSACSQTPNSFIVSPDQLVTTERQAYQGGYNLSVVDSRSYRHVLQINNGDEKQQLLSANKPSDSLIASSLEKALFHQGFSQSATDNHSVKVSIEQMLVKLDQTNFKFETQTKIKLKIEVNAANKTLTKTFNTKAATHGPLQADIAVLESEFNQLLGKLLDDIANDEQIQQYLTL
ncbi:YajG family lipoprotein [Psychrobium sp. 1_MG-2023]|uniref:YajG family lipoprotein n=1 Tax=Psychrobium sp. 1_MG-2023 TaxID=3062624 RepID=UPI0026D3870D|nr:YajG family lipoprotein [Psychrobium sp. 1_MG-2023]MDP2560030.1 YajG family lipoprotein [Psychrobium sp. 1_MG-2023]